MNQEILNQLPVELLQALNKELRKIYASAASVFEDEVIDAIADVRHAIKNKVVKPGLPALLPGRSYKLRSLEGNIMIGEYLHRETDEGYMFLIDGRQRLIHQDYIGELVHMQG